MGGSVSSPFKSENKEIVVENEDPLVVVPEIDKLLERDPYLKLHETEIRRRYFNFNEPRGSHNNLLSFISGMGFLTS